MVLIQAVTPVLNQTAIFSLTSQQISDEMYLSVKTVKNHVSSILAKLGLRHRTEAAIYARRSHQRPD